MAPSGAGVHVVYEPFICRCIVLGIYIPYIAQYHACIALVLSITKVGLMHCEDLCFATPPKYHVVYMLVVSLVVLSYLSRITFCLFFVTFWYSPPELYSFTVDLDSPP